MLSSAANIIGTSGQANYNAGWIEDAVATADHDTRVSAVRRAGLKAIPHEELQRLFDYILGASTKQPQLKQIAIGFDSSSISKSIAQNGNVRSPMFCHVRDSSIESNRPQSSPANTSSFKTISLSGDSNMIVDYIANAVAGKVAQLISIDASQIDPVHGSILSLGLDSLVAIELRNWIMREFDAPLQTSELITDQTINKVAEKIMARSRLIQNDNTTIPNDEETGVRAGDGHILQNSSLTPLSKSEGLTPRLIPVADDNRYNLPLAPIPALETTLRQFEESRQAFDSASDLQAVTEAAKEFVEEIGPDLQLHLESLPPEVVAEMYDKQIYLDRRDALQHYNEFSLVHPLDLPPTSQAMRAAIVTVAAHDFARRLAAGKVAPSKMHGVPIDDTARSWMFYCTRQPGLGSDRMEVYPANDTVAILRRGHVFSMRLPQSDSALSLESIHLAFTEIIGLSQEPTMPLRHQLEEDEGNAETLRMIDSAAFVICLDDELPITASDRHKQFLLNGHERSFANRWLDKSLQLAVTANGVSGSIFGHTKMDGLDARALHMHISESLYAHSNLAVDDLPTPSETYPMREYFISPSASVLERVEMLCNQPSAYDSIDLVRALVENSGLAFYRKQHVQPNATAHITVLLAMYLVDGFIRPAWEIASLGQFWRGRIDWMQTVTPAMRAFLEAVAEALASSTEETDCGIDSHKGSLKGLMMAAISTHAKSISTVAQGSGFVRHLYLLQAAAAEKYPERIPRLFQTRAWGHTRRDGLSQDLKIGFMPNEESESDGSTMKWTEGGFLMSGDRGVYVQCRVDQDSTDFVISASSSYAAKVRDSIYRASKIMTTILSSGTL
ncbi:hypothetical protein ONZ43_g3862 [Nemania bipapillata]|uniref:Uncharacterized protein n=1 Tax=Nemania bipapillata TaxID=110536 RepID=A0ACC2IVI3_9PEZI|nr:hypothetical protein ONZ43_g3862 [Nemania bipapillata]